MSPTFSLGGIPNDPSNELVSFDQDWTDEMGRTWRCYFEGDTAAFCCTKLCLIVGNDEVELGDMLDGTNGDHIVECCQEAYDNGIEAAIAQCVNDAQFEHDYATRWG